MLQRPFRLRNASTFNKIARSNYDLFEGYVSRRKDAKSRIEQDATLKEERRALILLRSDLLIPMWDVGYVVIVFAACAAEAAIYDYGARHLSDKFVTEHVDKLDTISKWVVYIRLVTGNEFPKGRNEFGLLKRLIRDRNEIVHFKSEELQEVSQAIGQELEDEHISAVCNSVNALDGLSSLMSELHPGDEIAKDLARPLTKSDESGA